MTEPPAVEPGAESMRAETWAGRVARYLLVEAERWVVAGGTLLGVFASLVLLGAIDPTPVRTILPEKDPIETVFQAYLTAIITGVTLVVTINQLVLAQELGAVGDQRTRMEEALAFRRDVEAVLDVPVAPPEPSSFLRALADETARLAAALEASTTNVPADVRADVDALADAVRADVDDVDRRLAGAEFGTFDVLSATLDYDYSTKMYLVRRLESVHADALSDAALEVLEDLDDTLAMVGTAREHFKTLYFQWELVSLSRHMLYTSIPAIVVTSVAILYVDAGVASGTIVGVDVLVWLLSGMATVALAPFALLLASILRIATVAKRTLAIGPFLLETTGSEPGA